MYTQFYSIYSGPYGHTLSFLEKIKIKKGEIFLIKFVLLIYKNSISLAGFTFSIIRFGFPNETEENSNNLLEHDYCPFYPFYHIMR